MFSSRFLGMIFYPYQKRDGLSNTWFSEFIGLIPACLEEKNRESPSPPPHAFWKDFVSSIWFTTGSTYKKATYVLKSNVFLGSSCVFDLSNPHSHTFILVVSQHEVDWWNSGVNPFCVAQTLSETRLSFFFTINKPGLFLFCSKISRILARS